MAAPILEPSAAPGVRTRTAKTETSAKAAWLEQRRTYIGATDVGAILGCNPYVSPHDVWLDKKGLKVDESTIAMRHGTYIESFIAAEYQRMTGVKIHKSHLYRHARFRFCACNPDREITIEHDGHKIEGLLECKSVGYFASKNFGQDGSDQIPEHYMMQVLWQLIITGKEFVHLAALIDNRDIRIFTYTLNPNLSSIAHVFPHELVVSVFSTAVNWWRTYIEADVEPSLEGHDSDTEWCRTERATYENGQLTNTDEIVDADCRKLEKALVRFKRAETVKAMRINRIKKFMADRNASELESTVGRFTWRTNVKGVAVFKTPFRTERA